MVKGEFVVFLKRQGDYAEKGNVGNYGKKLAVTDFLFILRGSHEKAPITKLEVINSVADT